MVVIVNYFAGFNHSHAGSTLLGITIASTEATAGKLACLIYTRPGTCFSLPLAVNLLLVQCQPGAERTKPAVK